MMKSLMIFAVLATANAYYYSFTWDCNKDLRGEYEECRYRGFTYEDCYRSLKQCLIYNSDKNPCTTSHYDFYHELANGDCTQYVQCNVQKDVFIQDCAPGTIYDNSINVCNWPFATTCSPPIEDYYESYYDGIGGCDAITIQRDGYLFFASLKHREITNSNSYLDCGSGYDSYYWGCYNPNDQSTMNHISVYITHINEYGQEYLIYPDPYDTTYFSYPTHKEYYTYNYYDIKSTSIKFIEAPNSQRVHVKYGDKLKIYYGDYYYNRENPSYNGLSGKHYVSLHLGYSSSGYYGYA